MSARVFGHIAKPIIVTALKVGKLTFNALGDWSESSQQRCSFKGDGYIGTDTNLPMIRLSMVGCMVIL
jgi:hypothetical protein